MRDKDLDPIINEDNINVNKAKAPKNPSKKLNKEKPSIDSKEAQNGSITLDNDHLSELYSLLEPECYELGISDNRIKRAKLVCSHIEQYSEEEKKYLVYPTLYQLHLHLPAHAPNTALKEKLAVLTVRKTLGF